MAVLYKSSFAAQLYGRSARVCCYTCLFVVTITEHKGVYFYCDSELHLQTKGLVYCDISDNFAYQEIFALQVINDLHSHSCKICSCMSAIAVLAVAKVIVCLSHFLQFSTVEIVLHSKRLQCSRS